MDDIKNYIIALVILGIIRWLLPKFEKLVIWIINGLVKLMEKLIKGSKMGQKRKKKVLFILRACGIKASQGIEELVDIAVDAMNNKTGSVKSDMTETIENDMDKVVKK